MGQTLRQCPIPVPFETNPDKKEKSSQIAMTLARARVRSRSASGNDLTEPGGHEMRIERECRRLVACHAAALRQAGGTG